MTPSKVIAEQFEKVDELFNVFFHFFFGFLVLFPRQLLFTKSFDVSTGDMFTHSNWLRLSIQERWAVKCMFLELMFFYHRFHPHGYPIAVIFCSFSLFVIGLRNFTVGIISSSSIHNNVRSMFFRILAAICALFVNDYIFVRSENSCKNLSWMYEIITKKPPPRLLIASLV